MASKKSRKRLKRLGSKVGRFVGNVAAPAGAILGGPVVGAAISAGGTLISAASAGSKSQRRKAIKRGLIRTVGIAGATAAIGGISGAGLTAPLTQSIPSLLAGGGAGREAPPQPGDASTGLVTANNFTTSSGLQGAIAEREKANGSGSRPTLSLADLLGGGGRSPIGEGDEQLKGGSSDPRSGSGENGFFSQKNAPFIIGGIALAMILATKKTG